MSPGWHPRVKPEHAKYRTADGRVRIGGGVFGIAAEVVDSTGSVWTMLCAADGSRTVEQIVDVVRREHPDERAEAVREALVTFAEAGYLDDAAAPDPPWLTEREKLRYDRSMRLHRCNGSRPPRRPVGAATAAAGRQRAARRPRRDRGSGRAGAGRLRRGPTVLCGQ